MKKLGYFLAAIFALGLIYAIPANAATFTVTNTNDTGAGSLRQAITDANAATTADTIVFDASFNSARTITLATALTITGSQTNTLTITGPGANLLSVSGNNAVRVFQINSGAVVSISGITITGGNLATTGSGGGINMISATVALTNLAVTGNSAAVYGGGIYQEGGQLNIANCTISNNIASGGTDFTQGGGLYTSFPAVTTISNSIISGNQARGTVTRGGGIYILTALMTITNSIITGNSATSEGGGIYFQGNQPSNSLNISDTTVSDNTVNPDRSANSIATGGGIYLSSIALTSPATITRSTISGNRALCPSTASNCGRGGGIYTNADSLNLVNSTVSGNASDNQGGGIYDAAGGSSGSPLNVSSSTIVNNTATFSGGGLYVQSGNPMNSLRNSIVANNTSGGTGQDISGTINSGGYNLIRNTTGATVTGTTTGNLIGVDPFLDIVLRSNGGATRTHALRFNSPAIDAGDPANPAATDQRGLTRPVAIRTATARVDIGAYERQTADRTIPEPFDFDGDGKADISVFRPSTNVWYLQRSLSGATATTFGATNDLIAPADFDGDGRADIAVFRPSNGTWYRTNSSSGQLNAVQFGQAGDLPRPGDFDGDERADIAVFRPSNGTWYYIQSSNNQARGIQFGQSGDVPVIVDFDADGKSDIAVFRPSNGYWYWIRSSDNQARFEAFGQSGDIPLSGDFNGNGRSDLAVFRPSNGFWYVARPTGTPAQNFEATPFGISSDVPVPADYDDDGKTDLAVFRSGVWYVRQSSSSNIFVTNFGLSSDKAIPSAFGN